MAAKSFRVGRVRVYLRGRVWYLSYSEQGRRRQPRVGTDRDEAKRMAAEVNAQLEAGAPSSLGFTPIGFPELRQQWLDHHEHVRRSSLQTIARYRTATQHLIDFIQARSAVSRVSEFRPVHAEEFVRYLRGKRVAPNGHKNAKQRPLRDAGITNEMLRATPAEELEEYMRTVIRPLANIPPTVIGKDTFSYRHAVASPATVWGLTFFNAIQFLAITGPRREGEPKC